MSKIVVIGGGAWGCALGSAVTEKNAPAFILTSNSNRANEINMENHQDLKILVWN